MKKKLGFCLTGSFCTFDIALEQMEHLAKSFDILPVMSYHAASLDTRFGKAIDYKNKIESICGKKIITDITGAEPIGPKGYTDIMLVAPCTGNTLAKLATAITDTPVTMGVKSHLRNNRPVVLAVSTNDALSGSAKNIGQLQNYRNYYFVPYRQDNYAGKPTSLVADFDKIEETLWQAVEGKQVQPMLLS